MESYDEAIAEAERALETIPPRSKPSPSWRARATCRRGRRVRTTRGRGRSRSIRATRSSTTRWPSSACATGSTGEAVDFASEARALDPRSWRGLAILGLNQLRLGAIDAGRKSLETSFAGDPYNVWIKNTLDLLDTFPSATRRGASAASSCSSTARSRRCSRRTSARWPKRPTRGSPRATGYRPAVPVRIEVYPSHADFSVRTVGLAGLGALGVCFGPVLAIDSPSRARDRQFNWGSTLWHELAHTVTLGADRHEVPRWLTRRALRAARSAARGRAGATTSPSSSSPALKTGQAAAAARAQRRLRPARPAPSRSRVSYYQASLVVEWIEAPARLPGRARPAAGLPGRAQHGGGASRRSSARASRTSTPASRPTCASASPTPRGRRRCRAPARSSRTPRHRDELVATADAAPGDFLAQLAAGMALVENRSLPRRGPSSSGPSPSSPSTPATTARAGYLAQLDLEGEGRPRRRRGAARGSPRDQRDATTTPTCELARLLEQLGDRAAAAAALERALYIWPFDAAVHHRLAALYDARGDRQASCAPAARWSRSTPWTGPRRSTSSRWPAAGGRRGRGAARGAARARARAALPAGAGAAARAAPRADGAERRPVVRMLGFVVLVILAGLLPAAADIGQPPDRPTRTCPTTAASRSCASASSPRGLARATTCGASTSSGTTTTRARTRTSRRSCRSYHRWTSRPSGGNILDLDDPELLSYPVAYLCELGFWAPTDAEARGLRDYLLKGGFLIVDDFAGPHWDNFGGGCSACCPRRSSSSSTRRTRSSTRSSASTPPRSSTRTAAPGPPACSASSRTTTRASA